MSNLFGVTSAIRVISSFSLVMLVQLSLFIEEVLPVLVSITFVIKGVYLTNGA